MVYNEYNLPQYPGQVSVKLDFADEVFTALEKDLTSAKQQAAGEGLMFTKYRSAIEIHTYWSIISWNILDGINSINFL